MDPPVEKIDPKEYADLAYTFMTGLPGFGSRGFCMMDPETLKKQRITYVRYWYRLLKKDLDAIVAAANKK